MKWNNHPIGVSTFASHTCPSTDQSLQKSFNLSYLDKIELKKISSPLKIKNTQSHRPTRHRQLNSTTTTVYRHGGQERHLVTWIWRHLG